MALGLPLLRVMATAFILNPGNRSLQAPPKTDLLTQARKGNREAFSEMVSPYVAGVYRRAHRLTGNSEDAEDISQQALLKAWSRLDQFSGKPSETSDDFRAWISRIATNASIDMLRQRKEGKVVSLDEPKGVGDDTLGSSIANHEENPEEGFARREMCRHLAHAIRRLPQDLRQACLLRDVLHYSTQEVAERLGISLVAVRLRLFRAHRQLRGSLQEALQPSAAPALRTARLIRRSERSSGEAGNRFIAALPAFGECACGD